MVFSTNQAFKWLGLVWGDYDGQTFVKRDPVKSTAFFSLESILVGLCCMHPFGCLSFKNIFEQFNRL